MFPPTIVGTRTVFVLLPPEDTNPSHAMAESDFDIDALAAYLHLTPQQVERLANRDKIPSRRIGGEVKFSRAEIHHWMEERMGLLDDDELAVVETRLQKKDGNSTMTVSEYLSVDTIAIPLEASTKNSVINKMSHLAAKTGMLWDPDKMADAVRSREDMQSTAMDNGVALLHPRRPLPNILGESVLALGLTRRGIPFGGSRVLTDVFWLICSTDDQSHLRLLARVARFIGNEELLNSLRASTDANAVLQVIQQAEDEIDA